LLAEYRTPLIIGPLVSYPGFIGDLSSTCSLGI
jgi:hypothetical protein